MWSVKRLELLNFKLLPANSLPTAEFKLSRVVSFAFSVIKIDSLQLIYRLLQQSTNARKLRPQVAILISAIRIITCQKFYFDIITFVVPCIFVEFPHVRVWHTAVASVHFNKFLPAGFILLTGYGRWCLNSSPVTSVNMIPKLRHYC